MKYKAYIFDFDGVLADSVEVKTKAFAKLFDKYGKTVQNKVVEHHLNHGGMTRVEKFKLYFKEFLKKPLTELGLQKLCDEFSGIVVDQVVSAPEIDGAEEFVRNKCQMAPCFVNSATPDIEIKEIIRRRGCSEYFVEVLGSNYSKTENLTHILKKYHIEPERSVFFGDATSDYQAAINCGVTFFAIVPDMYAPLLKCHPEIVWAKNFLEMGNQDHFKA
jgi:beta-phosphoglucomutase-like phosphatase (HAD superfamily)